MPRDAPEPHAAAAVAQLDNVRNGSDRSHAAFRGTDHVTRGSVPRRPLLRYASGWLCHTLDALFLDIRTSRGVHPDYSLLRFYVGDCSGIFPEADFRIPGYGRSDHLYRLR